MSNETGLSSGRSFALRVMRWFFKPLHVLAFLIIGALVVLVVDNVGAYLVERTVDVRGHLIAWSRVEDVSSHLGWTEVTYRYRGGVDFDVENGKPRSGWWFTVDTLSVYGSLKTGDPVTTRFYVGIITGHRFSPRLVVDQAEVDERHRAERVIEETRADAVSSFVVTGEKK